ncbi:hypothetical protein [Rickettsia gravesii]|uniref:hypothetical protein n=1 Tax=Rickettsia gravesii TaxID=354585 RepID=UPI00037F114D|nr:hypothetical protein [Rickettsia gravesii]
MYRSINAGYVILINGGDIKFKGTTNSLDLSEGSSFSPFALAINPEDSVVIFDESLKPFSSRRFLLEYNNQD